MSNYLVKGKKHLHEAQDATYLEPPFVPSGDGVWWWWPLDVV